MGLLDQLSIDAVRVFLTDFAECIIYTPYGGAPITLQAIVNRNPPTASNGYPGSVNYVHELMIANDPTNGVVVVNVGNDTVTLNNRFNGKQETFIVSKVITQDQGIFHVAVG